MRLRILNRTSTLGRVYLFFLHWYQSSLLPFLCSSIDCCWCCAQFACVMWFIAIEREEKRGLFRHLSANFAARTIVIWKHTRTHTRTCTRCHHVDKSWAVQSCVAHTQCNFSGDGAADDDWKISELRYFAYRNRSSSSSSTDNLLPTSLTQQHMSVCAHFHLAPATIAK